MKFLKSTLGKIALEIKTGKTPPTSNPEYFGDELNWYTPTDLDREKILGKSKRRITQKALIDKKVVVLKPNTILLGCIGDIGKIGLIKESASSNQQITGILPREEIVNSEFLYYWLKNNKNKLRNTSTSAIVSILNNKQLSTVKIEFPESLDDQIHIAEILSQVEDLITLRKESIALLDELLKSTFLEMFGTHTQQKFETDSIQNLSIKITDGTHQSPKFLDEGVPFLLVSNIINNEINYKTKKFISEKEYLELNKRTPIEIGDILITSVGSYGNPALVKKVTKFAFQRHIAYIKPDHNKINNVFLFGALRSSFVKIQIDKAVRGVAQLTLNLSELKKIQIPIPPVEIQNKFATIVEKVETLKTEYQASLKELENMYGVLSQKAFKEELKVKEYTNNEVLGMVAETKGRY